VEVYLHSFFDLGTRWRRVVSLTPRPLYPQGKSPGTLWIGGRVGPRAVLDAVVERKIPSPHRESNPRTPIVQPVAQRCTAKLCISYKVLISIISESVHSNFGSARVISNKHKITPLIPLLTAEYLFYGSLDTIVTLLTEV
jgi:hypothetical protein